MNSPVKGYRRECTTDDAARSPRSSHARVPPSPPLPPALSSLRISGRAPIVVQELALLGGAPLVVSGAEARQEHDERGGHEGCRLGEQNEAGDADRGRVLVVAHGGGVNFIHPEVPGE